MKAAAIILNFFFPGVGSLVIGKVGAGVTQLLLFIFGWLLILTLIGALIGGPMVFVAWVWSLITAATFDERPTEVHHYHHGSGEGAGGPRFVDNSATGASIDRSIDVMGEAER